MIQQERLCEAIGRAWKPHDRRAIYDWAAEHISLTTDYAIPGAFNVHRSRYLIEPFRAIADDTVRVVTIQKGIQSGGSLLTDISIAHLLCTRPQNCYLNFPTDDEAKNYAERRLMPLLEENAATGGRILEARHINRHKVRSVQIIFSNMWLVLQGANKGNLQSHSVPVLFNEELWDWARGMYQHAEGRVSFFSWRSKIVNVSQAGLKGCDQDLQFHAGTQEEWEVPCPECRHYQPQILSDDSGQKDEKGRPIYAGIIWDTNEVTRPGGRWNWDALAPTVRYRCSKCLSEWPDTPALRRQLDDLGQYRVTNLLASREHRSFHWPSVASPDVKFSTIAKLFLEAKDEEKMGNRIPIQEFYLKRQAVSFDPAAHLSFDLLPTVVTGARWPLQEFIFMLVDVQADHFWVLIQAWSMTGQDCVLWFGRLNTWQEIAAKQKEYDVPDRTVFVDMRHRPNEVYKQCVLHGYWKKVPGGRQWVCWNAMMGDGRREFLNEDLEDPARRAKIRQPFSWPPMNCDPCLGLAGNDPDRPILFGKVCPRISFAKGTIDSMSFDRRELMLKGETSLVSPGDWNKEFAKQMQGEQPETVKSPLGHETRKSRRIGANHALDCYRMGLAAACVAKILHPF